VLTNVCTGVILVPWLAALAWFGVLLVRAIRREWRAANTAPRNGFEPILSERQCAESDIDLPGQQRRDGGEQVRVEE
jgi:hypothetical protein